MTGLAVAAGALALGACVDDTGARYLRYSEFVTADGGLRTDAAPTDAPYSNAALAMNFEKIALNREYRRDGAQLVQERTPSRISRWDGPLRYKIIGDGATAADHAAYAALAGRLTALTGLDIREDRETPNVSVLILNAKERSAFVRQIAADGEAERLPLVIEWAEKITYPCIGQIGYRDADTGRITGALIFIKAELQGVFRQSCIHEELSQAMGLMNDDDTVRPSIFNDDQEFALLTEHDEYLLRILYDPRLRTGMDAADARLLVPEIIEDLRPEGVRTARDDGPFG